MTGDWHKSTKQVNYMQKWNIWKEVIQVCIAKIIWFDTKASSETLIRYQNSKCFTELHTEKSYVSWEKSCVWLEPPTTTSKCGLYLAFTPDGVQADRKYRKTQHILRHKIMFCVVNRCSFLHILMRVSAAAALHSTEQLILSLYG